MKTFGEILKEKRKAAKLSRHKLSKISGINENMIFLYESEKVFPNMINLIALADAFNCSMDEMVGREIPKAEVE
jgi:transcriptional regulator with XRE-family HTH domain